MGVTHINKSIILIVLLILLSNFALGAIADDTSAMTQLNERLDRMKAEIIKSIRDTQATNQNATSTFIDQNFQTLDRRIQEFLKASKRDIAIIMVAGFLIGFALSQIIRLSIERSRKKSLIKRAMELEIVVQKLEKEAVGLSAKVRQLKNLDMSYTQSLKKLTKREPFIPFRMVLFGIFTLLLGVIITYFVMGGKL